MVENNIGVSPVHPLGAGGAHRDAAARDRAHLWHPWTPVAAQSDPAAELLLVTEGDGYRVRDSSGRSYLDAIASSLNGSLGYGDPAVLAAAHAQMSRLPHFDLTVGSHEPAGRLAERLAGILPQGLDRTLFMNSGSESAEASLNLAFQYWRNVGTPRSRVISFAAGYHGATLVGQHLSGLGRMEHHFTAPFPVTRVELPLAPRDVRDPAAAPVLLARFEEAMEGDDVAAVIVEPFLNVGGGVVLPPGFLSGLRKLCDASGALLVLDEVFCGIGRTGLMYGFDHDGITPDVVMTSKGISGGYVPLAAVTTTDRVYQTFRDEPVIGGLRYAHTTSGHAVACAVALAVLDEIGRRNLVANAAERGRQLLDALAPLAGRPGVVDVRGLGLVVTVETDGPDRAGRLLDAARDRGVLLRGQGASVMAIPPLVIDAEGVGELAEGLLHAAESVA
ncbi:aspartate aminotransferase family protein [Streptomyces sp. NPDC127106]|uniref:aminotransferase family protein n=1 Tax=Streptomyces sp. NPDC127106 TaxID=3345360 RepID=UPI003625E49D